jgi:hypothetical protein
MSLNSQDFTGSQPAGLVVRAEEERAGRLCNRRLLADGRTTGKLSHGDENADHKFTAQLNGSVQGAVVPSAIFDAYTWATGADRDCVESAKSLGVKSMALTFDPHPLTVLPHRNAVRFYLSRPQSGTDG